MVRLCPGKHSSSSLPQPACVASRGARGAGQESRLPGSGPCTSRGYTNGLRRLAGLPSRVGSDTTLPPVPLAFSTPTDDAGAPLELTVTAFAGSPTSCSPGCGAAEVHPDDVPGKAIFFHSSSESEFMSRGPEVPAPHAAPALSMPRNRGATCPSVCAWRPVVLDAPPRDALPDVQAASRGVAALPAAGCCTTPDMVRAAFPNLPSPRHPRPLRFA